MRTNPSVLDYRSFDEHVDELARRSPMGHELPHVVQQASSNSIGRRRLLYRLKDADPQLWFAITSGIPLTERQAQKLGQHLASTP